MQKAAFKGVVESFTSFGNGWKKGQNNTPASEEALALAGKSANLSPQRAVWPETQ